MKTAVRSFRASAERYLEASYELFPQHASDLGLHQFDALLGENDAATHRQFGALVERTLREVEALPDHAGESGMLHGHGEPNEKLKCRGQVPRALQL